jgi:hypothetical protein
MGSRFNAIPDSFQVRHRREYSRMLKAGQSTAAATSAGKNGCLLNDSRNVRQSQPTKPKMTSTSTIPATVSQCQCQCQCQVEKVVSCQCQLPVGCRCAGCGTVQWKDAKDPVEYRIFWRTPAPENPFKHSLAADNSLELHWQLTLATDNSS